MAPVRSTARAGSTGTRRAVFLLEAYVAPSATDRDPVGEILAVIRAEPEIEVVGTVVIPDDETMLCLIEAPSEAAAEAVVTRVGRGGIRLVEVRWLPARPG